MELREKIFLVLAALDRLDRPSDEETRTKISNLLYTLIWEATALSEDCESVQ